jgi:hypothetical protein
MDIAIASVLLAALSIIVAAYFARRSANANIEGVRLGHRLASEAAQTGQIRRSRVAAGVSWRELAVVSTIAETAQELNQPPTSRMAERADFRFPLTTGHLWDLVAILSVEDFEKLQRVVGLGVAAESAIHLLGTPESKTARKTLVSWLSDAADVEEILLLAQIRSVERNV